MRTVAIGALIMRINRRLNRQRRELKITRGQTARRELGNYYVLDLDQNLVVATHLDPERTGRELRVVDPVRTWSRREALHWLSMCCAVPTLPTPSKAAGHLVKAPIGHVAANEAVRGFEDFIVKPSSARGRPSPAATDCGHQILDASSY
jgi:hypothetical protein